MKIVGKRIPLNGGDYNWAYNVEGDIVAVSNILFTEWCQSHGVQKYFKFGVYYTAEMFGDIDHTAILVKKRTPKKYITALLLRWS